MTIVWSFQHKFSQKQPERDKATILSIIDETLISYIRFINDEQSPVSLNGTVRMSNLQFRITL